MLIEHHKAAFTIVAMLAVLKAGGAFAALDVSHPDERLLEIIEDTKATLLLSSPEHAPRFGRVPGLSVIDMSNAMTLCKSSTGDPPKSPFDALPNDIMYTIFTSGTTGRPKGVMVEHGAWLTSALAYGSEQGLSRKSRVLQFASYAFDMSLMEIFTTLIFGGCVCVPADADRFGMIEDFVNKTGVNTLMLTPSYAKLLDPASMPSLQTLITGGEPVPSDLLETWTAHVDVYIAYGPTEASIQAAGAKVCAGSPRVPSGLIGHATGCNLWIARVDNPNELVPDGETGELLIEGYTLARGYLGDRVKTEAAFITVTLGGEDRRMFKTGDLVRRLSDGNIVFVGRGDTQIKIQGQRFELTEIEARLSNIVAPGSHVCVDKVDHSELGPQGVLTAFISESMTVSDGDNTNVRWDQVDRTLNEVPHIRAKLGEVLPFPMIPTLYVPVTFIALTTSHKVDRKAMRKLVERMTSNELDKFRKPNAARVQAATISPSELALRELWGLVLGREPQTMGPEDDFIQLGGDSVTSIKLVSAARDHGITLTSAMVLSNPVLKDMARQATFSDLSDDNPGHDHHIEQFALVEGRAAELRATAAALCKLPVDEIENVLPMSISQMRWYGKTLSKPSAYVDQYHFQLPGDIDLERLFSAVTKTVRAAELLRARALATADRKLFLAITKPHDVQISEVTDSLDAYLERDLQSPMGLGTPLSRYAVVKVDDSARLFVWTIHHALYDGFSLPMLLQTIEDFYQDLQPPPFTPFDRYLEGPNTQELTAGEGFWTQYLSGCSWTKFPELPSPEQQSASSMKRITRDIVLISTETVHGTKSITTANVVRVAYAAALSLHSSNEPGTVLFLESLGGRNSTIVGIDRVAGPTLLTIPTRIELAGSVSCAQLLAETQWSLVERMRYENFPLPRLLPLAPALELRNVLMIEDEAFLINGTGAGLFGRGHEELKLDETEGLPMICRCTIGKAAVKADIRYDETVARGGVVQGFLDTFERVLRELSGGDARRPFKDVLLSVSS
jgi:amino acid adenylation domain-containing protein